MKSRSISVRNVEVGIGTGIGIRGGKGVRGVAKGVEVRVVLARRSGIAIDIRRIRNEHAPT